MFLPTLASQRFYSHRLNIFNHNVGSILLWPFGSISLYQNKIQNGRWLCQYRNNCESSFVTILLLLFIFSFSSSKIKHVFPIGATPFGEFLKVVPWKLLYHPVVDFSIALKVCMRSNAKIHYSVSHTRQPPLKGFGEAPRKQ